MSFDPNRDLRVRRGSVYIKRSKLHELLKALDFQDTRLMTLSISVMRNPIAHGQIRSPDSKLMGIFRPNEDEINLSKLVALSSADFFDWAYMRYKYASEGRLMQVKDIVVRLSRSGFLEQALERRSS